MRCLVQSLGPEPVLLAGRAGRHWKPRAASSLVLLAQPARCATLRAGKSAGLILRQINPAARRQAQQARAAPRLSLVATAQQQGCLPQ